MTHTTPAQPTLSRSAKPSTFAWIRAKYAAANRADNFTRIAFRAAPRRERVTVYGAFVVVALGAAGLFLIKMVAPGIIPAAELAFLAVLAVAVETYTRTSRRMVDEYAAAHPDEARQHGYPSLAQKTLKGRAGTSARVHILSVLPFVAVMAIAAAVGKLAPLSFPQDVLLGVPLMALATVAAHLLYARQMMPLEAAYLQAHPEEAPR